MIVDQGKTEGFYTEDIISIIHLNNKSIHYLGFSPINLNNVCLFEFPKYLIGV